MYSGRNVVIPATPQDERKNSPNKFEFKFVYISNNGENYIMRSLFICTSHPIMFGS